MIPWSNWSSIRYSLLLALLLVGAGWGQDLDYYFNLAYQGKVEEVAAALPQLYRQHPNDGSILYLESLITQDGETAFDMFMKVVRLYPTSPYADDALLKIGEYLYARGLYLQATQYLKRIPVHYPRSDLIYPSIRLFLNALLVSGNRDTALFYAQVFAHKFPDIEFDLDAGKASDAKGYHPAVTEEHPSGARGVPERPALEEAPSISTLTDPGIRLQAGAFGMNENAERRKAVLESLNYRVKIIPSRSDSRTLYIVVVEGFASRQEALKAGELLKENYGIDTFILSGN